MLLSIVVPFFNINKSLFLPFIDSLKNQDCQDFELLIIDDGSNDPESISALKSIDICNLKIYHKANGGLSSARNFGLNKINGDLLWIIDPDDFIPDNSAIRKIINVFVKNPEITILTFGYIEKLSSGKIIDKRKSKKSLIFTGKEGFKLLSIGNGIMSGYTWNKVFNLCRLNNLELFDGNLLLYEDKFWLFKILDDIDNDKCLYIPDILYQYNYNQTSLSHTISEDKAYSAYIDYILPYISSTHGRLSVEYQSAVAFIYRRCWYESFNWLKYERRDRQNHYIWLKRFHDLLSMCRFRDIPKDVIFLYVCEPLLRFLIGGRI